MEYRIVENNSDGFWEDKNNQSFGLKVNDEKEIIIKLQKNNISIEGKGINAFLYRDKQMAKVSVEGKVINGTVRDHDRLHLEDGVIVEFFTSAKININFKMPKINWNLWVGVSILLLIMVIIFAGWKKNSEAKAEANYQKVYGEIRDNIKKSDDIKSIDLETSLELLNEAKEKIPQIKDNKKHTAETIEIEKQVTDRLASGGSAEVVGFTEVYDTKIADTVDRIYDKIEVKDSLATLVDSNSKKVVQINLETKSVNKFELNQEIVNIVDLMVVDKSFYVYDGRYIWESGKTKGSDMGEEVFSKIGNWNKNWYLLGQNGKVSKMTGGKIDLWTSESATLIDKPVGMVIDGTVWVVGQGGVVQNYERGVTKKWSPSIKIEEKVLGITTTADSQKVAIVSDQKVYVFEKSGGKLISSYNFEKLGIVNAKMGSNDQVFVLAKDQKIYKVK